MNSPTRQPKHWFDDWKLSVKGFANVTTVQIDLPHNTPNKVIFDLSPHHSKEALNLLDKLLCELTGTKDTKLVQ